MLVAAVLVLVVAAEGLRRPPLGRQFAEKTRWGVAARTDEALFLTPYIQAGELEKGRNLSKVRGLAGTDVESYAGYLTVNEEYNSNMFFWFFPAKENPAEAPVVLWLQGGPGGSSMFGLLVEHGPFSLDNDLKLVPRDLTWVNTHNMLYIDNPVGTGFSFTEDDAGYATNEEDVGRDLHSALTQFFTLFESYQSNDFYVTGESYGGKYVPATAYKIHMENPTAALKINLKGMAIGDGLVDPINQLYYGDILYNIGFIDDKQLVYFRQQADETANLIEEGKLLEAFYTWDAMMNGATTPYPTYYKNVTGFDNYYNYLYPVDAYEAVPYDQYLNLPATREAIHVGDRPFNDGQAVLHHLLQDMMNSTKPMVTAILDGGYRVMIYNGQLDVIIGYTLTEQWLATAKWHGAEQYKNAERSIWRVDDEIAGYVRVADNLYDVMENPAEAPVVLWLQGGPGGSSMFGLLVEHGPIQCGQ
ncbi:LOW QUALITY PROTEIN: probable serine carboxypeptidase CPVL [Pollicipes pollicipes]|uniref:LOW QUALITY PROTEIN: probable serine carboxypeptidase CPVL n=1 Tax=Pollicipes pollicipes TaxID=41117 RepID=UPI001884A009|nr:LOW QUALITY PROTEIN: probable serine carboxypeptidase CPVL [Pollicipes pollicipes]